MQPLVDFFHSNKLLLPLAIAAVASVLLLVVRSFLLRFLEGFLKKNDRFDHGLVSTLRAPSVFWTIAIGLYIGVEYSELSPKIVTPIIETIHVLLAVSMTIVAANGAARLFKNFVRAPDGSHIQSGLAMGMVRGSVMAIGAMVILSILGISITPVLTALGVGGLAVALALKDTLENLFAGIYLLTDRTIRVGDVVKLDSGQDGVVDDIGWRTTRIRTFNSTTVILPNSKLAQASVTNYCIPDQRFSTGFTFMVAIENDPSQVEALVTEILKKGSEDIVGIAAYPEPVVRFINGFIPGALEFTVTYTVTQYTSQGFTQHELKKRIFKIFREKNISFPPALGRSGSREVPGGNSS
ncbi:MAG: mechanosensitive ion channel family protein [Deltaproteobacteria bacterium]|nr:mechanosensitive ion channel family protein [Deltaproteobacteria bacterium]MBI3293388.1 mechanosensitive ion channel family protein [Deltaproteobacteria bacterium]